MSGMDVLNISVGVISLVLGGFAIWLSVYFFIKAKESEKETAKTLEAIRTQSDALQKLTGRWMDRFTRYATEPKPADEGLMMLVNTMANLPTTILTHLRVHTTTEPAPSNEALFGELTDCYIALYYYIAIANVSIQALLPDFDNFDSTAPVHTGIKLVVDQTASDFDYMARVLAGVNESRLKASRVRHLLEDAQKNWRPFVRNTEGSWSARKKSE